MAQLFNRPAQLNHNPYLPMLGGISELLRGLNRYFEHTYRDVLHLDVRPSFAFDDVSEPHSMFMQSSPPEDPDKANAQLNRLEACRWDINNHEQIVQRMLLAINRASSQYSKFTEDVKDVVVVSKAGTRVVETALETLLDDCKSQQILALRNLRNLKELKGAVSCASLIRCSVYSQLAFLQYLSQRNVRATEAMAIATKATLESNQEMKVLAKSTFDSNEEMKSLAQATLQTNEELKTLATATLKTNEDMKGLAFSSASQAEATNRLAADARRDSEVMKAITVVTIIFLPATFVSVSNLSPSQNSTYMLTQHNGKLDSPQYELLQLQL